MKRISGRVGIAFLTIVALVVGAISVSASGGPPGGGFYSGQTIQNLGTTQATASVTLYDMTNPATTYTRDWTIPAGGAVTFFAEDIPGVPVGFIGSAVVSSDQPVKAVVNVTNRQSGSRGIAGGTAAAQYRGIDDASTGTLLVFPLAKAAFGPKTTAFYIQNAGSAAATFTARFLMGTGLTDPAPVEYSYTSPSLAPGQMAVIVPADAGVPTGRIGSLTVTSAQKLAGMVLEYETTTSPALILQGTTGFTPNDFDTRILFPVVKKQLGGRSTGLQVQNVGDAAVDVTLVYRGAGGSCPAPFTATEPVRTLQPKQSTTYLDSTLLPAGCLASAEATATGNIAGVVNEAFLPCGAGCTQRATTYAAFPAKAATTKLVAPVFKEDFGGKRSGMSIQNVSDNPATATVVFKVGTTTYTYNNLNIPAKQSALLLDMTNTSVYPLANWAGGSGLPDGSLAAVTVTANQPIIGLVNEAPLPGVVQDNINYEAFNVTP